MKSYITVLALLLVQNDVISVHADCTALKITLTTYSNTQEGTYDLLPESQWCGSRPTYDQSNGNAYVFHDTYFDNDTRTWWSGWVVGLTKCDQTDVRIRAKSTKTSPVLVSASLWKEVVFGTEYDTSTTLECTTCDDDSWGRGHCSYSCSSCYHGSCDVDSGLCTCSGAFSGRSCNSLSPQVYAGISIGVTAVATGLMIFCCCCCAKAKNSNKRKTSPISEEASAKPATPEPKPAPPAPPYTKTTPNQTSGPAYPPPGQPSAMYPPPQNIYAAGAQQASCS